ncbi:MAG: hypothetical protein Q8N23_25865 [Archangium sp.]|nr:hypothetical protein [Archangium sp.]MDP3571465.1 hypothetical protein [Archangium sp.]
MKRLVVISLGVLAVGGCVKRVIEVPPEAMVSLGRLQAPWRPWAQVDDLCAIDPKKFTEEQQAMTALLVQWLGQTSAPADGAWDDEHVALLEEGVRVLPGPLQAQQASLKKAASAGCRFEGLGPATEFNGQGLRRVEEGPELARQVKGRLALAKWKEARPAAQANAKAASCGTKMKPPAPILYFAAEDENARLEWLFCDGSMVVATPGNTPSWVAAPTAKKTKKEPDPKVWLDVAAKFPPGNVSRAPKLPKKKVQREENVLEPEEP